MEEIKYSQLFNFPRWQKIIEHTTRILKIESCVVTGAPLCGKRTFLKCIEERLHDSDNFLNTIIVTYEVLPEFVSIEAVEKTLLADLHYKLPPEMFHERLSLHALLDNITKKGTSVIFIINRFQFFQKEKATMRYIESLRNVNPFHIRFLIGCDTNVLLFPEAYKEANMLTTLNQIILPPYNAAEISEILRIFGELFGWEFENKQKNTIILLSGGNISLVKYIAKYLHEHNDELETREMLIQDPAIRLKLKQMHEKLLGDGCLFDGKLSPDCLSVLRQTEFLDEDNQYKSKLFEYYITQIPHARNNLSQNLTANEYTIFAAFQRNFEDILTLDDIAKLLWGEKASAQFSSWAIYKTISNINKKIKSTGFKIDNKKGRGYILHAITK